MTPRYTLEEIAAEYGISVRTLRHRAARRCPDARSGKNWRLTAAQVRVILAPGKLGRPAREEP